MAITQKFLITCSISGVTAECPTDEAGNALLPEGWASIVLAVPSAQPVHLCPTHATKIADTIGAMVTEAEEARDTEENDSEG